jgi:hypothetical protein
MGSDNDHISYIKSVERRNTSPGRSNIMATITSSPQPKKESIYQPQKRVPVQSNSDIYIRIEFIM